MDQELAIENETRNTVIDLIWKAIDGKIKPEQLVHSLTDIQLKYGKNFDSLVADTISIIDVEIGAFTTAGPVAAIANDNVKLINSEDNITPPASKKEKLYFVVNHLRSIVGDDLLKERLDIETLEGLKIIPKKELFNQKYIKIKTRLFYKQQKFNLLREESEGFSKLITELGPNNLNSNALENIQSLIGCFNLDPNRVLDIILESFENNLPLHGTFIGLLKHYKAEEDTIGQIIGFKYQSLHQVQLAHHQKVIKEVGANNSSSTTTTSNSKDNKQQQVASAAAHYDAAFFESLTREKLDLSSLYEVTAHLLKHNIVDLDLLLPHLYPSDQQIQQMYKEELESARQYAKKLTLVNLADGSGGQQNELQNMTLDEMNPTGGSSSSGNTSSGSSGGGGKSTTVNTVSSQVIQQLTSQANFVDNHRVCLVKACIEIGDYSTAMKLIEKMPPWFLAIQPDVATSVCASLDANFVDKMYQRFNLLPGQLREKYAATSATKTFLNEQDISMSEEEESERVLDDFVEKILPILCSLGPGVSYSPILFTKLIRIFAAFLDSKKLFSTNSFCSTQSNMEKEGSPPPATSSTTNNTTKQSLEQSVKSLSPSELRFYNSVLTVINDVLMPSISMLSCNPCIAIELWNLIKNFPYEMRYYLYNNWKLMTYKQFPHLIRARADCQEKIKYLLKRLTKENVKIHGRQIGKLSHNNPIIVCDYILTQIQRYDNFILPVVESLKFMTPLSYDVLSYCIIIAISDADKDKMKTDSTNISSWLQSIATFSALTFKKYPIELIAIIQCVIDQLKLKKSCDLLILQEIVQKMSGIEVLSEVNDMQLEAMAGGDLLRQEAGYFNPIRNIKKCANRLKEALADHGLILPLCILLSQQRDYIVFTDKAEREKAIAMPESVEKTHLKLIGSLYDQCQDSLVQFSQFLSSTLTTEEYIHIFPKIDELVTDYHVSPDVAFFLSRPMYAHHIQSKYEEFRRVDRGNKAASSSSSSTTITSESKPSKTQRYLEAIEFVMEPVCTLVRSLHSSKVWDDMSPLFYTTFWTLSMNDLYVPTAAYDKQRASLKQKLNEIDDNQELTSAKKKKEKEKITIMMDKLQEEENKQKDHVQHVRARFEKEKDFWFPEKSKTKNETITVFLQLCIFSRCLFTQIDAYYCAKFIQIIHSLKTPNFSTIICYDRIFSDISYSVASLTENEARRYGRFLLGLLETVMSWHGDTAVFDAECSQHPGFLTVFRNMSQNSTSNNSSSTTNPNGNKLEQLDYENFRHVCHKWHYKLTKCFIVCLQSEEYIQMRNSLIILTKIASHYPKLTGFASALEKQVEKIKQKERDKRQDIFTLASAYLGQLKLRRSSMIEESKFHQKEEKKPTSTTTSEQQSSLVATSSNNKNVASTTKSALSSSSSSSNKASSSTKEPSSSSSNKPTGNPPASTTNSTTSSTSGTATNGNIQSTSPSSKSSQQNGKESSAKDVKSTSSSTTNNSGSSSKSVAQSSSTSSSSQQSTSHPKNSSSSSSSSRQSSSITNAAAAQSSPSSTSSPAPHTPSRVVSSTNSSTTNTTTANSSANGSGHRESRDYSPTSSVSSDEVAPSPKPPSVVNRHSASATNVTSEASHHHHHHHNGSKKESSRSSSPQSNGAGKVSSNGANNSQQQSNSSSGAVKSSGSSSSSSDKAKRQKIDDSSSYSSSKNNEHQGGGGSSTRRKSRDRGNNEKVDEQRKDERKVESGNSNNSNKDKKDHRKRELSNDSSDAQRKRSKSDEAKKKQGGGSSSSQPGGNSNNSSSSSSRGRGSNKKDGNYDDKDNDYQSASQSSSSSSNQPISSNSSGRHRDDRKNNNDKHYYKDKK